MSLEILLPPAGHGPGIVVAHAWWGLNQAIRDYGAALARDGFVVGLVDLFEGETAATVEGAEALAQREWTVPADTRLAEALRELAANPAVDGDTVSLVSFSYSGFHGLGLAKRNDLPLAGVVAYYATRDLTAALVPVLVHFAAADPFESDEDMRFVAGQLAARGAPSAAHVYDGTTHWFAEADRPEYDAAAADLAFARTVAFLRR